MKSTRLQCSSKDNLVRLSVNSWYKLPVREVPHHLPSYLATLSHWLGAACRKYGKQSNRFQSISAEPLIITFPTVTDLKSTFSLSSKSIPWVTQIYSFTQVWEATLPWFPYLPVPEEQLPRGEQVCGWTAVSLLRLFSGAMTDTHLLFPMHSLSFRATTNVVVMQPLLLFNLHPNTEWAICKPNAGFSLLFQLVKQDFSYNHRCKLRERGPEKLNSCYNISFW